MKASSHLNSITVWILFLVYFNDPDKVKACRNIEFVNKLTNRALRGHTLKTVQTKDFDTCRLKCYLEDDCVSINFSSNGKCDLSSLDHNQRPDDLIKATDSIFSAIENPCASSPCVAQHADTKCQAGFTDRGYRCLCAKQGFTGERCEKAVISIHITSFPKPDDLDNIPFGRSIIEVNGIDHCNRSRGHNIVTVYPNGSIHASRGFDTYGSSHEVDEMKAFIESLPDNLIVLIAVWDSTAPNTIQQIAGMESVLSSVGAVAPLIPQVREAWLLVGYKGPEKPAWIQQRHGARNEGPIKLWTKVAFEDGCCIISVQCRIQFNKVRQKYGCQFRRRTCAELNSEY